MKDKTIEAFLKGYILFTVNGKIYFRYNSALKARKAIKGDVEFSGWNLFKRSWECFFIRFATKESK